MWPNGRRVSKRLREQPSQHSAINLDVEVNQSHHGGQDSSTVYVTIDPEWKEKLGRFVPGEEEWWRKGSRNQEKFWPTYKFFNCRWWMQDNVWRQLWQKNDGSTVSVCQNDVERCHLFCNDGHRVCPGQRRSKVQRYLSWNTPFDAHMNRHHMHPTQPTQVYSKEIFGSFKQRSVTVANEHTGPYH